MFIGPWEGGGPWNSRGIDGVHRFLNRVWNLVNETAGPGTRDQGPEADARARSRTPALPRSRELEHWTHKTIKKVTEDLAGFHFNTAISALMEYVNFLYRVKDEQSATGQWREAMRTLVLLLAPMTPHIAEELWERMGGPYSVQLQGWPSFDEVLAQAELITLVLQVNGKVRDRVQVAVGLSGADAKALALANEKVRKFMDGKQIADVVVVPGRLVNVVTK
ncbi:MAG: class I tRNA ligase family protein, partial [bacterium]